MAYVILPIQESFLDYPDPMARCLTVFFVGCNFGCAGCHNKELQQISENEPPIWYEELDSILDEAAVKYRTNNIALMGGEPLHDYNIATTIKIIMSGKWNSIIYTGYSIGAAKLRLGDIPFNFIKCGLYDERFKQQSGKDMKEFRLASSNQELYTTGYKLVSNNGVYTF